VRELRNVLESAAGQATGAVLSAHDVSAALRFTDSIGRPPRREIVHATAATLEAHEGSRRRAAEALGIHRTTLWRRLKRLGTHEPDPR
jgi:transcriptional regulator of acetoin/glycerol metabolism